MSLLTNQAFPRHTGHRPNDSQPRTHNLEDENELQRVPESSSSSKTIVRPRHRWLAGCATVAFSAAGAAALLVLYAAVCAVVFTTIEGNNGECTSYTYYV